MTTLIETSKERLDKYLNAKGISKGEFYRDTSLKRGLIDNDKLHQELSSDKIATIIAVYDDLNLHWLISGKGDMIKRSTPNRYNTEEYNTNHASEAVAAPLFFPKSRDKVLVSQDIPLLSVTATGGILENLDHSAQYVEGTIHIPDSPKCDGAVRVAGDSMAPIINAGDIIAFSVVHDLSCILYGQIYFVDYSTEFDDYFVCKIIRKSDLGEDYITLNSYNPRHDPIDIPRKAIRHLALVKLSIHYHMIG